MTRVVSFDQALEAAGLHTPPEVYVTVASNQADGICSYAQGQVVYRAGFGLPGGVGHTHAALTTDGPLNYLFSNRRSPPAQGFAADSADKLGLSLARTQAGVIVAHFDLQTWSSSFSVELKDLGGVLAGKGESIGNADGVQEAVYLFAFATEPGLH
jgi:hypothetical protein